MMRAGLANFSSQFNAPEIRQLRHEHANRAGDPRQNVLNYMDSIDVAACPGSGKTTLLVAKLAILAEKWQYRTRGICVLSHTNAARHEIEKHLGNTATGRRLLGYFRFNPMGARFRQGSHR